jgi:transposase
MGIVTVPENQTTGSARSVSQERGARAGKKKVHTATITAQVALAAHEGDRTVNELAGHDGVHPTLIHAWKKPLLAGAEEVLASPPGRALRADRPAQEGAGVDQEQNCRLQVSTSGR